MRGVQLLSTPVGRLRVIAFAEGVSCLLLFFVAMPIKYVETLGKDPMPVKYVGWVHGVLFIAFGIAGFLAMSARRWPRSAAAWGFVAALLPGGSFVYDAKFLKPEYDLERAEGSSARGLQ
jgi:integral membrane protein